MTKSFKKTYKSLCYCTNMRRSAKAISDIYNNALKKADMTVAQYYILINLERMGRSNITHWAERVGLDRSTMIRNIKLLQSKDWIDEAEGHGKQFELSEKGRKNLSEAKIIWENTQREIERLIGKESAEAIININDKIMEAAEKILGGKA